MRNWEKFIADKLGMLGKTAAVYDIGGGAAPREREAFTKYILVDVDETYNPDIVADIQKLPFTDGSVPSVLCLSVLEHVENPFKAAEELYRVLPNGGIALISVPFMWPYHANEHYKDYWRFSKDGLKLLFNKFSKVEIVQAGGYFSVLVNLISSYTKIDRLLRPLAGFIDERITLGKTNIPEHFIFLEK